MWQEGEHREVSEMNATVNHHFTWANEEPIMSSENVWYGLGPLYNFDELIGKMNIIRK